MANIQGGTNYAGAGATTLSALIPIIYEARDRVAREQIGLITAATRDASEAQAAVGQTVRSPVTQPVGLTAIAPSNVVPNTGGQTILYKDLVIANSYAAPIQWTGEEQRAVGSNFEVIFRDQFTQAFRTLDNTIEASLVATMLNGGSSRATGAAGTSPFNTVGDFSDFANAHLILDNNGAPEDDRRIIMGFAAYANMTGKQSSLWKANEAGTDAFLRKGIINEVLNLKFHKSAQIDKNAHTKGTGAATYASDGTGSVGGTAYAVGETAIKLKTGSGTVVAGDIVTFAGDANVYVVVSGVTAAGQVMTIAAPGLQQTLADAVTMTVGNNYKGNMVLHPTALMLATRAPIMPAGGDAAAAVELVYDEVSGISYQVAEYKVYRQVHYEVGAAWGSLANKPEFAALLLG
jgi:hypothetical protein